MKLTKSQRLKALTHIVGSLSGQGWTQIDLALKQFGFPTTPSWSSEDTEGYIVNMLEDASDADLLEFAEHFGWLLPGASANTVSTPETAYWAEGNLRVFITHLSAEKEVAAALQSALEPYGFSCFVAHNDIHPTNEWQLEIEAALSTCDLLVALLHPGFVESPWCDQEIGIALGREEPVFMVRMGADPHGFVSRFQAFTGQGKTPEVIAKELFEAALTHKKLQEQVAPAVIRLFETSDSFAQAKKRIQLVERLTVWDPSFSKRLKKAVADNGQISGSFGVPQRVAKLVKDWAS